MKKKHFAGCGCALCRWPFLDDYVEEITSKVKVERAFVSAVREEERLFELTQPRTDHWASDTFKQCDRLQWFRFNRATPTNPGGNIEVMQMGNDIEEQIVEARRQYEEVVGGHRVLPRQSPVAIVHPDLRYPIKGRVDFFVIEDEKWVPVEVKSTKGFGGDNRFCFECRKRIKGEPDAWERFKPSADHVGQLITYMAAYQGKTIAGYPVADYGVLHYRNRNTAQDLIFKIRFSPELFSKVIEYFKKMEAVYEKDAPPDVARSMKPDKFPCGWVSGDETVRCAFWDRCWKKEKG